MEGIATIIADTASKLPAFTPNFSIKLIYCVAEPVMMLYVL